MLFVLNFQHLFTTLITKSLLTNPCSDRWRYGLTKDQKKDMARMVSNREIYKALLSVGSFKAPGKDRYYAFFFKKVFQYS